MIVVYLTGHILLNNTKIQQDAAVHVVSIASSALGTDVEAGRVQFTYPFGITIDNLTVYDLQHDTLAHVASLSIRLKPLKLLKKKVSITSIRINSPSIRLYTDDEYSEPNYAFLTALAGTSDEPMSLRANSVLIRNGSVRYDRRNAQWTDSIFNPNHIGISSLTANMSLKALSSDSVSAIIRKISFNEQSGFRLPMAKGAVIIGKKNTNLSGFEFSTPSGEFEATRLTADAGFASVIKGLPDMDIDFKATVTGSDFKAFYPQLSTMTTPITLSLKGNGRYGDFDLNNLHIQVPDSILELGMSCTLWFDSTFNITACRRASIHGNFSDELPQWLTTQLQSFGLTLPNQLTSLGDCSFNASLDHLNGNTASSIEIISEAGTAICEVNGRNGSYSGSVTASDINLHTITGNRDLGNCSLNASAEIWKQDNGLFGRFNGRIGSIRYKKYNYRGITVNGSFTPDLILSDLKFADKNGAISMDAGIGTGEFPFYTIKVDADSINLAAYHLLSNQDSMSLTATLTANIIGNDIDKMTGKITVDSLYYVDRLGNWSLENMTVAVGQYNDMMRVATVYSDFLNISVIGDYRISRLPASLAKACSDALRRCGAISRRCHRWCRACRCLQ